MTLSNKIIVITGASKGLGQALALALAKEKAKLVLSSHAKKELAKVSQQTGALAMSADVTKESQVKALAKKAVKKFGRLDIWINNAGIWLPQAPVEKLNTQRVKKMVEVNLFGTIYGSKAALIQMKKQKSGGTIINILSTSALNGRAGSSGYCASKYGATGFTNSLRLETAATPVRVISVYPGGMQTHFFDEKKPADYHQYMIPTFVAGKIVENLKKSKPKEELMIKRPTT